MKISTFTHHGARILLCLAFHAGQTPMSASMLADQTGIPLDCVEDVLVKLGAAGYVRPGPDSRFFPGCRPEEISLGHVVRLMDGGIRLSHCRNAGTSCPSCHKCKTKDVWRGVSEAIERELDAITLADLMAPPSPRTPTDSEVGESDSMR